MKHRLLLGGLVLAPFLACADPLSGYGYGETFLWLLGIFAASVAGGLFLMSRWGTQGRRLFIAAVFLFCLGVSCYFNSNEEPLSSVALFLFTVLVLGLLLGPLARSASLRKAVSLAVKVVGLSLLLVLLLLSE